jgi:hypothetical protein
VRKRLISCYGVPAPSSSMPGLSKLPNWSRRGEEWLATPCCAGPLLHPMEEWVVNWRGGGDWDTK